MIESTCSVVDVSTMLPIFTGETGRCLTIVREYNRWYCMYLNKPIKPLKYFAMNFHSVYNALQNYGRRADYNLSTAELNPDKGYWVALELPGKIYNKPSTIDEFKTILKDYLDKNKLNVILSNRNLFLNFSVAFGELHITLVEWFETKNEAIGKAKEINNSHIFDCSTKNYIHVTQDVDIITDKKY